MFVPKTAGSLRNSRRRPRTSSSESVKQPKTKRQRSVQDDIGIQSQTEHDIRRASSGLQATGPTDPESVIADDAGPRKQLAIRGPKKSDKQEIDSDIDGSIVLSKTNFYTVSQLPALPDTIRELQSEPFNCFFGTGHGYSLVLTHSHAVIWPYSSTSSSPPPTDIFTFSVPESNGDSNTTPPFGVLLSNATPGPPGLIVIMPSTGKICYWETVSSATSLGLSKHKQDGLHGSISGLLPGEMVTDVVNAEPSGLIATLSSGRVAHITIRDPQGKPTVLSGFLRSSTGSGNLGFLGGIKNVLGGGFSRKEVASTRPGESHQRGQRDIMIATTDGLVEVWDTHWNNGSMLKRQFDVGQHLREALHRLYMETTGSLDIRVVDFALATDDAHESRPTRPETWAVYLVVRLSGGSNSRSLLLVQIVLSDKPHISSIRSIDLHHIPPTLGELKPRLFIPRSGDTGFLVLGQSVIMLSLAPSEDQLTDSRRLPRVLYDTIDFRAGVEHEILGCDFEEPTNDSQSSACLVMVRGFGVIRVSPSPRQETAKVPGDAHMTTAKHKLEQAVFYGTMAENPLDLSSRGGLDFSAKELEQAALEICRELLRSTSTFIPSIGISLDQNLRSRAKALDDLACLLIRHGITDNGLMWELLWGAEKIAAQRAMWKIEHMWRRKNANEPTFLSRVIKLMSEKFKTKFEPRGNESDHVRHWFLHDTYQMEHIIPWIFNAIKPQKGQSRPGRGMAEKILEASEFSLAILETAFRFREEQAGLFGLNEEFLEDGVLVTGYENLPEFWTSHSMAYIETGHLLDLELGSCMAWTQPTIPIADTPEGLVQDIAKNCARQLRVFSQMHVERIRWLAAQGDSKSMDEIAATEQSHVKQRRWQLFKLAGVGQLDDAVSLAEKFRDMSALVELVIELQDQTNCQLFPENISDNNPDTVENDLGKKISHYFDKFGEPWANAFFSRQISMGQSGILFAMRKFQPFVTRFLRGGSIYSRLSWINDVVGENSYNDAASSLERLAIENEPDLWSHRVELSLAKLTRLASWEHTGSTDDPALQKDVRRLEDYAEVDAIQEVVHAHISPSLQGAIDQKAEIDLAVEQFGNYLVEDKPSLHEVLVGTLTRVTARQVIDVGQLVDILTLLDIASQSELSGKEFYLALQAVELGSHVQPNLPCTLALQKLVWRRCLIKDDWEAMGMSADNISDDPQSIVYGTALFHTLVSCLKNRPEEYTSLYIPASPVDALLNESDLNILVSHFHSEQRARVAHDLTRESEILNRYVEAGNLEFWFKTLRASNDSKQ